MYFSIPPKNHVGLLFTCFLTCLSSVEYKHHEVRDLVGLVCYYVLRPWCTTGLVLFSLMNEMSLTLDCELWALGDSVLSLLSPQCPLQGLVFMTQSVSRG